MTSNLNTPAVKKQLFEIYNNVNKSVYGYGAIEAKISFLENTIIFQSRHNRTPILVAMEEDFFDLKCSVDTALMKIFKERLNYNLTQELDICVKAILRDYDPETLIGMTAIVIE